MDLLSSFKSYSVPVLNVSLYRLAVSLIALVIFMILRIIITKIVIRFSYYFADKTKTDFDDKIVESFEKPIGFFITVGGLYFILEYLFDPQYAINTPFIKLKTLSHFLRASFMFTIGWGIYNLVGVREILTRILGFRMKIDENSILFPLLSKFLRIGIVLLTFGAIAAEFEYDMNGFVTGLGISGLAIALATQDSLANLFGGVTLLIDKPFKIGDWVKFSDIEGIIEDIGLRSIRVRTFEKALVTVPNSKLTNEAIVNFSRRGIRRVTFNLGVTYSTSNDKLQDTVIEIEKLLKNHPQVDKETIVVRFNNFGDSSLDIFILFFTNTSDYEEYLHIKQDINFKILELVTNMGVDIAFPSKTIYIEKNE